MAKAKNLFEVKGEIEKAGVYFKEQVWAYSEAQAKKLIWARAKEKYPKMKVFLINIVVEQLYTQPKPQTQQNFRFR